MIDGLSDVSPGFLTTVVLAETYWDFADALIHERGVDAGCRATVTFDKKAADQAGMRPLA